MTATRLTKLCNGAFGAALAVNAVAAFATESVDAKPGTAAPVTYAQASTTALRERAAAASAPEAITPMEARVRAKAREGPTALRRYIRRTEPIYHYSFWDYAKYLPEE